MVSRLLTQHQAADILGVDPQTLVSWRKAGRGPNFVTLDPKAEPVSRTRGGRSLIRYRLEDLQEWHQVRPARDRFVPPELKLKTPTVRTSLTDHQWAVVQAAFVWELKMERLAGNMDLAAARGQLEAILEIAGTATAHDVETLLQRSLETGTNVLLGWVDHGWLEVAFKALADVPDFQFLMVRQVSIMPHQAPRSDYEPGPMNAVALRTTLIGPLPPTGRAGKPPHPRYTAVGLPEPIELTSGVMQLRTAQRQKRKRDDWRRNKGLDAKVTGDAPPPTNMPGKATAPKTRYR